MACRLGGLVGERNGGGASPRLGGSERRAVSAAGALLHTSA